MAPKHQSTSPATVTFGTVPLAVTLPPHGNGPCSGPASPKPSSAPAPHHTQHGLAGLGEVVGSDSPFNYTKSILELIIGFAKTPSYAFHSPHTSLHFILNPDKNHNDGSVHSAGPEGSNSLQLCNHNSNGGSARPDALTIVQGLSPTHCATTLTFGAKEVNFHVSPDNKVYRWSTKNSPIPVGINLVSFEQHKLGMGSLVQRCLIKVLAKFNTNDVGPKFKFISDPSDSAFFVTFGGNREAYACAFFPDSGPKDWYIWVYSPSFKLNEESDSSLNETSNDIQTAREQVLERQLVKILTHEMLHVVGVRHCDAQDTEREQPCVRFPTNLTDEENNEELLMHRQLHWRDLSRLDFDWNERTLEEIRQIYSEERKQVGNHEIREISWQKGAQERKEIARNNAGCCTPKPQNSRLGLLMWTIVIWCLAGLKITTSHWF